MIMMCNLRWKWGIVILLITPVAAAAEGNFQTDVQRIQFWEKRDRASLIALDKFGEELLDRYQQPEQQGEIYYYLAHQHAQGGLAFPQKAIDYAGKALERPVTPDQKMRLYVYQGDAFQVLDRKKPFAEKRREAVVSYLQGLKELETYQLPNTPPVVPSSGPMPPIGPQGSVEKVRQAQRIYEEAQRKYIEARDQAKFTRTMMKNRDVLKGQVVSLYGRSPVATEELRTTATKVLGEGPELERLMTAVEAKVAKLPPEEQRDTSPVDAAAPTTPSKYLYLTITLAVGAAVAVILLLLARRNRARRSAPSTTAQKN